jgi:ATP-dependent RNA helicase DeaD
VRTIARLLARTRHAHAADAREVRQIFAPQARSKPRHERDAELRSERSFERGPRGDRGPQERAPRSDRGPQERAPREDHGPRQPEGAYGTPRPDRSRTEDGFASFRVSWGSEHGADARRLLAVVCRRGDIRGRDVGAIRVERNYAIVDVANSVSEHFALHASEPDPRDPRVSIRKYEAAPPRGAHAAQGEAKPSRPFHRPSGESPQRPQPGRKPFKKARRP